ncbi:hypothetical protein Cgig2_022136 [Carnegiea gigantea]|uniref:Amine oxidase domain-containing protein n=1 Tax=Carnegiea gigantea TaxID=171969 RepID=A0A9Q1K1C4_9CARY|nr:hypothetical protein Cgig2_022136 [Carnegiea gigantea]
MRRIAVIGGGISGLGAAYELAKAGVTFPHMTELFDSLGIDTEPSDVTFSVSLDSGGGFDWGTQNGLRSVFAQKSNLLKPNFWSMIREIKKFKDDVIMYLEEVEDNRDMAHTETLGHFIKSRGYRELFQKAYLLSGYPQWLTVRGRSHCFVKKITDELELRGAEIKTGCEVHSVLTSNSGSVLFHGNGLQEIYDGCVMAVPAPDAIKILGKEATLEEMRILGAFHDLFLHHDKSFMPQNLAAWSAWNFLGSADGGAYLTYWLNVLQNIDETGLPCLVTLNPPHPPTKVLLKWSTGYLVPSVAATKALLELDNIQGKRGIWFSGLHHGNGSHEDALKAGMIAAHAVLGRSFTIYRNPKQMVPSWTEAAARHYVTRFLKQFISSGSLILLEEGGDVLTFEGSDKRCDWKTALRVHSPKFYWKIAAEADLGLADAFINGDFTVVDKNDGLLNLFRIILAKLYIYPPASEVKRKSHGSQGWWKPVLFTAAIASVKYFCQHVSRKNTVTRARQNVARHYDLSNEMFALFLDETMTYSCAIFKARVEEHHELLEIGCGWGSLAIEVVKKTGCRYTGITLAEEQLKLAEQRVKEAGLEDRIRFLLCDYRQLPSSHKYDRIISCGMLEHVGDEYYEDFFRQCESLLADNGVLVVQTISIPDERFDGYKRSSDFIREYIFPGGCLPSLSRITSAMATASRLCVEHAENIGVHYAQTLRCWRRNFLENQSKIHSLGFDEKFMRVWEYYFDYCAAGFITRTLGDYQIVFSRQGNLIAFCNPYESIPSVHSCS